MHELSQDFSVAESYDGGMDAKVRSLNSDVLLTYS